MEQLIKSFDFNGHGVRVITNEKDQVFFVAKDVCEVLGYAKASSTVIQTHCKLEGVTEMVIPSNGGEQRQFIINESNLYRLVMKSKKKEAIDFQDWVCDEVLPSIRKTGKYEVKQKPKTQIELIIEGAMVLQQHELRLSNVEVRLNQIEENKQLALTELSYIERSTEEVPEIGLRLKINQIVRLYVEKTSIPHAEIWKKMYSKMLYAYHFNVNAYKKRHKNESNMDIVERENQLDNLFALVSRELV